MCGRYVVTSPLDVLRLRFGFEGEAPPLRPRYNVAPLSEAPVVLAAEGGRRLVSMGWGLVPSWTKDLTEARRPINARADTVAEKPSYRGPLRRSRAVVPADGFYEWQARPGGRSKVPHLFRSRSGAPLGLAGLYDVWRSPDGGALRTFAILTTEANPLVARVHDRMPVLLSEEGEAVWLDPAVTDAARLAPFLVPFPASAMEGWPVAARVGNPTADGPDLVQPAGPPLPSID
ncbi:SOS response-associated peptidase [Acidobacteria bacterium ACD]|nr:MAG: SOS response-associated peptidase [Acidobacteriota bacterium]MCE7957949.1 SOS response-associated peptidase [Acidobacteria bacterium ACB2]MDL1948673.1 SOS response-associated peptidase [Acidobacteria bacterium ACD]